MAKEMVQISGHPQFVTFCSGENLNSHTILYDTTWRSIRLPRLHWVPVGRSNAHKNNVKAEPQIVKVAFLFRPTRRVGKVSSFTKRVKILPSQSGKYHHTFAYRCHSSEHLTSPDQIHGADYQSRKNSASYKSHFISIPDPTFRPQVCRVMLWSDKMEINRQTLLPYGGFRPGFVQMEIDRKTYSYRSSLLRISGTQSFHCRTSQSSYHL
ncbi:hypothetical protein F4859DRAFT_237877 [Xylaria cf. heliscus]|nr:hypothetical protein F4859DRAFT_237877 [Xylaria cf. heliscus]